MSTAKSHVELEEEYARAAEAYMRRLSPEHFMEATPQATQREITVESLAVLKLHRPDMHYFNELLVQYRCGKRQRLRQVVPDNMVVLSEQPIQARGSYNLSEQPAAPFWVLEYVSKGSVRKDYEDNFDKYETDLKVPYYLLFYPDTQDLTLYHHNGQEYVSVKPDPTGRCRILELELELALLDGWVRYWYRGQLLPLPADLQRALDEARRQIQQTQEQLTRATEQLTRTEEQLTRTEEQLKETAEQAQQAKKQAEQAQQQADLEQKQKEKLLAQLRKLGIEPEW